MVMIRLKCPSCTLMFQDQPKGTTIVGLVEMRTLPDHAQNQLLSPPRRDALESSSVASTTSSGRRVCFSNYNANVSNVPTTIDVVRGVNIDAVDAGTYAGGDAGGPRSNVQSRAPINSNNSMPPSLPRPYDVNRTDMNDDQPQLPLPPVPVPIPHSPYLYRPAGPKVRRCWRTM